MATSTGKTGQGIRFMILKSGSPAVYVTVGNARSISPTGKNADEIDFTHLLSTGGYREFRQGFKDGGTIGVEFHFDPTDASHIGSDASRGLLGLFNAGTVFTWRINFFNAGWSKALEGTGFVQNPGDLDINVDNPVTGSATVRVTGSTSLVAVSA